MRIQGKVNADVYVELLRQHVVPFVHARDGIWQQDNAPCHTAKKVKAFLAKSQVEVEQWPPQSPEMSPIENLWAILGKKMCSRTYKNKDELYAALE